MSENPYHTSYPSRKPPSLDGEERKRFELASPYGPNLDDTSVDTTYAAELLHAVRDGWEEMRAENPDGFVGLTIHGSTIKGRIHDQSDVDPIIFFDQTAFGSGGMAEHIGKDMTEVAYREHVVPRIEEAGYGSTFRNRWGVFPRVVNEPAVVKYLGYITRDAERTGAVTPSRNGDTLPSLFFMRVGSGHIPEYRQTVLDTLADSPVGEAVWKSLMWAVQDDEEHRRGATIYLPDTIQDGYEYFGCEPHDVVEQTDIPILLPWIRGLDDEDS